jgi:molybdenum cofactor cytidylyltransferase
VLRRRRRATRRPTPASRGDDRGHRLITGVILAAGTSSRLGRPKQLLPYRGRPVLQHPVDAATTAGLDDVVVVLGHAAEEVEAALSLPAVARCVVNPDFAVGQSTSLRVGLRAAHPQSGAAVVLLGDQPQVRPEVIRALVDAHDHDRRTVALATYGGRPGHPVLFDRAVWPEVESVRGDTGARDLLARHPEWVAPVEVGGEPPPDLDTPEDYERLLRSEGD